MKPKKLNFGPRMILLNLLIGPKVSVPVSQTFILHPSISQKKWFQVPGSEFKAKENSKVKNNGKSIIKEKRAEVLSAFFI